MSFLLDTNILSELRKGRRCEPRVRQWAAGVEPELHTSVVVLGELKRGVERARPKDPSFAAELERWLTRTILVMGTRILPVNQAIALEWGRVTAPRTVPPIDGLLAATARVHGLTLVTRNVKDFADLGVSYLNPFLPIALVLGSRFEANLHLTLQLRALGRIDLGSRPIVLALAVLIVLTLLLPFVRARR